LTEYYKFDKYRIGRGVEAGPRVLETRRDYEMDEGQPYWGTELTVGTLKRSLLGVWVSVWVATMLVLEKSP